MKITFELESVTYRFAMPDGRTGTVTHDGETSGFKLDGEGETRKLDKEDFRMLTSEFEKFLHVKYYT